MSEASIGQAIKLARTAKKLTLKQVTKAIHIREEYLAAIEKDRLEDLPSPVQGRGFIRLYWSYLELDETELENMLCPDIPEGAIPPPEQEPAPPPPRNPLSELSNRAMKYMPRMKTAAVEQKPKPSIPEDRPEIAVPIDQPPRPSDQVIIQIGEQLKNQRQRLSLSLEDIETYTHIPVHYLRALESGNISQLPSPVQGRGMLNNYASFLDLDVDAILMMYADALQLRREELEQQTASDTRKRKPPRIVKSISNRMVLSFDVILVSILMLVAFAALFWGAGNILAFRSSANQLPTKRPISDVIINTIESSPSVSPTSTTAPESTQVAMNVIDTLPAQSPSPGDVTTTVTGTAATQASYSVQVFIVAVQRSYLKVVVDGKVVFNGRTIPGNPYTYNGNKQVELISGNAAAIQVSYNGNDLGTLGVNGAVIHLIFGLDTYGTPTLTPTNTATETLRPSRTPRPSNTYPPTRTKTNTATKLPTSTPNPTHTPKGTLNP